MKKILLNLLDCRIKLIDKGSNFSIRVFWKLYYSLIKRDFNLNMLKFLSNRILSFQNLENLRFRSNQNILKSKIILYSWCFKILLFCRKSPLSSTDLYLMTWKSFLNHKWDGKCKTFIDFQKPNQLKFRKVLLSWERFYPWH